MAARIAGNQEKIASYKDDDVAEGVKFRRITEAKKTLLCGRTGIFGRQNIQLWRLRQDNKPLKGIGPTFICLKKISRALKIHTCIVKEAAVQNPGRAVRNR